ncbi:MAG: oxidoreductase [Rhodoglobus sp.]|nr:oxidoreductase [Rhodoglobus sp.]
MKQWLDRVTGAVTMYTLVLIILIAIGVLTLVLSLFGQLSYGPLAVIASSAVAVGLTVGSGWLIAKIMRVTPHISSSLITGMLLFFVMEPKFDLLGISGIALAAVAASISKYLIAVRGRHIFNPAAFGAIVPTLIVFTTFIGMSYGAWWVGTPFLQPAIIVGAFIVLYRTQRLTIGVSFVLLATVLATTVAVVSGQPVLDALRQVLLQSPIIFFAGFMFSEPLTLPPRRWQQFIEVVVVAVLFTVPLSFLGPVSNSPLFALLVGNLIGFAFGQRRGIRMRYLGKTQIGPTTWELAFQPARSVRFLPGQYMELTIPHRKADFRGSRRYFSISSAPSADGPITFALTKPSKSSSFKNALLDLEPGATVHGTSVGGDFALPRNVAEPLLLVAGGIGITPFASQLAHATERGEKRDVVVVYATSATGELPYGTLLAQSGARVVLFAPEPPKTLSAGWEYAGDGRVTGDRLIAAVPDAATRNVYVSGPPALVNDLRRALKSQGTKRVHSDYFSGY